ncbi:MAG: FlgD immunoglobulin-like domain containing protein [bacterium]|nr:FlgD immunoglobulin-like domain containing protein [bacterium]
MKNLKLSTFLLIISCVFGFYSQANGQQVVKAWGHNDVGQVGDGTTGNNKLLAITVALPGTPIAVAGGGAHQWATDFSMALLSDGTVWAWGNNSFGQLGDGTIISKPLPVQVSGITNAIAIAAGGTGGKNSSVFGMALLADGTVKTWGGNTYGQLGNGTIVNSSVPVSVSGLTGVTAIACGGDFAYALLSNGTIKSWGRNNFSYSYGQGMLGDGTIINRYTPVTVYGITNATAIAACAYYGLALLADGTIRAWGNNSKGQLGDGTKTTRLKPVKVCGITNATAIAGSYFDSGNPSSIALLADGTLRTWGCNNHGQLGDGTIIAKVTPVKVSGITNAIAIARGGVDWHAAILADRTVKIWGYGDYGQLGDGTIKTKYTPVTVPGVTNVQSICGGQYHCLVITNTEVLKSKAAEEKSSINKPLSLQTYPMPFNSVSEISYYIPNQTNVTLTVYSADGRKVKTLVNAMQTSGQYNLKWDGLSDNGKNLPTGIYYLNLNAGTKINKKLIKL